MLQVVVEQGNSLCFRDPESKTELTVNFQRTLRIPDDGKDYPLPPGLGSFPIRRVLAYKDRVPESWVKTSGVFIPMYQREALWISFQARYWRPNAVKVAAGKINAVSGKPWDQSLKPPETVMVPQRKGLLGGKRDVATELQDYLVCPPQPWLDGFNTGEGKVRQFVAMPLGMGYTVEGQVTGKEEHGGIQIIVYEPKPGKFPTTPPIVRAARSRGGGYGGYGGGMASPEDSGAVYSAPAPESAPARGKAMGLAAGGAITQKIYPDPHGIETWDESNHGRVFVHIVNSMMWREITGEEAPPTPVTAKTYTAMGFPWFKLYDEHEKDVASSPVLEQVKSVAQMDAQHGFVGVDDDAAVPIPDDQVKGLGDRGQVPDGEW